MPSDKGKPNNGEEHDRDHDVREMYNRGRLSASGEDDTTTTTSSATTAETSNYELDQAKDYQQVQQGARIVGKNVVAPSRSRQRSQRTDRSAAVALTQPKRRGRQAEGHTKSETTIPSKPVGETPRPKQDSSQTSGYSATIISATSVASDSLDSLSTGDGACSSDSRMHESDRLLANSDHNNNNNNDTTSDQPVDSSCRSAPASPNKTESLCGAANRYHDHQSCSHHHQHSNPNDKVSNQGDSTKSAEEPPSNKFRRNNLIDSLPSHPLVFDQGEKRVEHKSEQLGDYDDYENEQRLKESELNQSVVVEDCKVCNCKVCDCKFSFDEQVTGWRQNQQGLPSLVHRRKHKTAELNGVSPTTTTTTSKMPNIAPTSRYKTIDGPTTTRRFSSPAGSGGISGSTRETFRIATKSEYKRLGNSYHHQAPKPSFFSELKRFLLLLLIVGVCAVILWQIYEALIEEDNFLGVVRLTSGYSPSILGKFNHYAVSTDAEPCARVGKNLLAKGGHAVDAAIGTLICMGVVLPNSLGLGGGCMMTIYDNVTKTATIIDGRETAPDYATETMFMANPGQASRGPLSVGVPGELAAYWEAHQRFGRLDWSQLFDESIEMAEKGFPTVEHLSQALRDMTHAKYITPPLAKLMTSNATGEYYLEGETMYQRELAATLRRIRDNGIGEFYGGQTGQLFVQDLQAQGGKITLENLSRYKALIKQPLKFDLNNELKVYTQPIPGSGLVLGIILRIMKELGYYKNHEPQKSLEASELYYHHLAEAFKFAYAQRAALEDQPDDPQRLETILANITSDAFIKQVVAKISNDKTHPSSYYGGLENFREDHGTAHASTMDHEGNSVAVTTSVNLYFGSGLVSPSTGIIYNDVMDDFTSPNITNKFALPPARYNRIRPGKRPLSSMAPSVFVDGLDRPRLILGASGGSKITTAIASVALRNLYFGEDIKTAIDGPRIHHQFLPDEVWFEANFPPEILQSLANRGHKLTQITGRSSVVMAIAINYQNFTAKSITANSDYRKGGTVDGA